MFDGTKFNSLLKQRGVTQRDLASALGLSTHTVNFKVKGKVEWTRSEMLKVCETVGAKSLDELFGKEFEQNA